MPPRGAEAFFRAEADRALSPLAAVDDRFTAGFFDDRLAEEAFLDGAFAADALAELDPRVVGLALAGPLDPRDPPVPVPVSPRARVDDDPRSGGRVGGRRGATG